MDLIPRATATGKRTGAVLTSDPGKALRWRMRRGMRELDEMLLRFHAARWESLEPAERQRFEELLSLEDDQLWSLLQGRSNVDDESMQRMIEEIRLGPDNR